MSDQQTALLEELQALTEELETIKTDLASSDEASEQELLQSIRQEVNSLQTEIQQLSESQPDLEEEDDDEGDDLPLSELIVRLKQQLSEWGQTIQQLANPSNS